MAGSAGLGLLFGGATAIVIAPGWVVPLVVIMVIGIVLLTVAFLLASRSGFAGLGERPNRR